MSENQTMRGIGSTLVYEVQPEDKSVSVQLSGQHQGYGLVIEGISKGSLHWVKQEIFLPLPGGRQELAPGAFDVTIANQTKYFAIDVLHPQPLTSVRIRLQQWLGNERAALVAVMTGLERPPKPDADTGVNQSFEELKGKIITVPSQTVIGDGFTPEANGGGDYRQLMLGYNITSMADGTAQFALQTKGADDVWYTVWQSEPETEVKQAWVSIGVGLHINRMFSNVVRVAWSYSGGEGMEFSASLMGRTLPP